MEEYTYEYFVQKSADFEKFRKLEQQYMKTYSLQPSQQLSQSPKRNRRHRKHKQKQTKLF